MAKGGADPQATAMQRRGLDQQDRAFQYQRKADARARKLAKSQTVPKFEGAAAVASRSDGELDIVADEMRRKMSRKQGLNSTVFAGGL